MKNLFIKMKKLMLLFAGMIFIVPSCTNLDEELYSEVAAETFFTTERRMLLHGTSILYYDSLGNHLIFGQLMTII